MNDAFEKRVRAKAILKFSVWLMVLVVIWLTLWARQLRKQADRYPVSSLRKIVP